MNRYLVVWGYYGGIHKYGGLVCADNPTEAIQRFIVEQEDKEWLEFHEDGSLTWYVPFEKRTITYPHVVAYLESHWRVGGEWHLWEFPPEPTTEPYIADWFCTHHEDEVATAIRYSRPELRRDFPGRKPRAFVWYLRCGTLVTFYYYNRFKTPFQIHVLARYLLTRPTEDVEVRRWRGTYQDIMDQFRLRPWTYE